jgi:triosephosphate isomerase
MRQLIAGNWKMNGLTAEAAALAGALRDGAGGMGCDLLVCPPFTQIGSVAALLRGTAVGVGGQDCHAAASGAHTGDISAAMLADLGCTAVILGHSERRQHHGETDARVRAKVQAAARAGLMAVVCVGETEAERDGGHEMDVVGRQVAASLPDGFAGVLAYEPIWAIGTGRTARPADVEAMHRHIRAALLDRLGQAGRGLRILYGGSVKADNAAVLLAVPEVGGALVGGASLDAAAFLSIARAAPA